MMDLRLAKLWAFYKHSQTNMYGAEFICPIKILQVLGWIFAY